MRTAGECVLLLFMVSGCMDGADTEYLDLDIPECKDTEVGRGCLTINVRVDETVEKNIRGDARGTLHWGLYHGGDVGLFGPGDNEDVAGGEIPDADFSVSGTVLAIITPNLEARSYQVLCYLDDNGSGESDEGDIVTLPFGEFTLDENEHLAVTAELNYVR
ncbi:MAG: hypothetical protein V3T05_01075 [Myxococcota bacterium]